MAVQPQTPFKEYTANGTTSTFPLGFSCEKKDHLIVMVDGVEVDFLTWSLVNEQVIFAVAPLAGKEITFQRNTPFERIRNYQSYDNSFRPGPVNKDFDWIWWKLQELGVADWILNNRINKETQARILADIDYDQLAQQREAELKAYIDGIASAITGEPVEGLPAHFVDYNGETQKKINDGLSSVFELLAIKKPQSGMRLFVKSYHNENAVAYPEFLGSGWYVYDSNQAQINNGGTIINGWVLIPENNTITPYHFGWSGRNFAADIEAFQKCLDAVKDGQTILFWHTARLEKQIGKHADIYGVDGRTLGHLTLNGGQPCLILRQKKNVKIILRGAELYTETACLGLIDLYKCHRCKVHAGMLTGGNYIRETRTYKFPPIDGTTGHAEKGTSTTGFNTTTLIPDIGGISNNAVITQNEASGGYGGQFPQFGGTTSSTWGSWRGGQLGNHSDGIRVIGGFGNEIISNEIHGFNGSGIRLGLLRSLDAMTNYPRISTPESRAIVPKGTKISGNYLHNCYIGGCHSDRSIDTYFDNYNIVEEMGHPDASLVHANVDPGYGFSTSRSMPNFKLTVQNNTFTKCFRKGIDCHQGSQLRFSDNSISGTMFHGVGIAVDDDFADTFYQPYFEHVGYIKDNEIEAHEVGIFYANGQFGRARREAIKKRWEQLHVNITGNTVKSTNPFFYNFAHSPFNISGNTFIFAAPYAHQKAVTGNKAGVYIGSYAGRGFTAGDIVSKNTFFNSKDGNFAYMLYIENGSNQTKCTKVTENHFDVTPWFKKDGADSMYLHNDVSYRSGLASTPISYGGGLMPQDSVIEGNTVWNDFNHDCILASTGGGTGFVGYPLISGDGRITGIQVLSGGSGYAPTTTLTVRAKSRATGATFKVNVTNGEITSVDVLTAGRFYRSSYNLSVPRGLVRYDMTNVSGSSCHDAGIGQTSDTGCILSVIKTDLSAPENPFLIENGIRYMQTKSNGQYAIHSGGMTGGAVGFWFKMPAQPVGTKSIFSTASSTDSSNNQSSVNPSAVVTAAEFTISSELPVYIDGLLYSGAPLSFDTPYFFLISSSVLYANSLVFGANSTMNGNFLDAKFAFIEIHRAGTYSANGVADLFSVNKALFGK